MSGVEEKPIKEEALSLRREKLFDTAHEEYMEMIGRSRRDMARRMIFINIICFAVNLFIGIRFFILGSLAGFISISGCILFLYLVKRDVEVYIDNDESLIRGVHVSVGY